VIRANRQGLLRTVGNRVLPDLFALYRKISPVRERVKIGEFNDRVEREHLVRYRFAQAYCRDKTVADIACGTGYGSEILREVARSVDGYDKEDLCQNFILDLETDCWERAYDVIVSFETIEHLADCDIFLENLWKTAGTVVISSPVGEFLTTSRSGPSTNSNSAWSAGSRVSTFSSKGNRSNHGLKKTRSDSSLRSVSPGAFRQGARSNNE